MTLAQSAIECNDWRNFSVAAFLFFIYLYALSDDLKTGQCMGKTDVRFQTVDGHAKDGSKLKEMSAKDSKWNACLQNPP